MRARVCRICGFVAWVGVLSSIWAQGTESAKPSDGQRASAERLVSAMNLEQAVNESAARSLLEMLAQQPVWHAHQDILIDYIEARIGWEALRPSVIRLYAETFSETELDELTRFYLSPVGRKLAEQTPALALRMQAIVRQRLEADLGKLELNLKNRVLDDLLELSVFATEAEAAGDPP